MRLLARAADCQFVLCNFSSREVPPYAILSHTWDEEEITFDDIKAGTGKAKKGWKKVTFCAAEADACGLQYFWIDTCCIDKNNSAEVQEAVNSMYRWYGNAAQCYVHLSDVSVPSPAATDQKVWEHAFRTSRWFSRGWTLPELIAPSSVVFYCMEGKRLGHKSHLARMIEDITGIPEAVLRGNRLSEYAINERWGWAKQRQTTIEEDQVYSLLGIFDVSMPIIYGEGRERASRRLHAEIQLSRKGLDFDRFNVRLSLASLPVRAQIVAREQELEDMHSMLYRHMNRSIIVLLGPSGVGKTQVAVEYTMRHSEKYSAIFWLDATDEDSLSLCFQGIAQQILNDHPSTTQLANALAFGDLTQTIREVLRWLEFPENAEWLLVYDGLGRSEMHDASDMAALNIYDWLPKSDHGSIIVTTRHAKVDLDRLIHVSNLSQLRDSLAILLGAGRNHSIDRLETDDDAIVLVQELHGFPLALSIAGAYLQTTATSCAQYLKLYREALEQLRFQTSVGIPYADRSLLATWRISLAHIEQNYPASAQLFRLWAYFDRQDVWYRLLGHGSSTDIPWVHKVTKDELEFDTVIEVLCAFGLVEPTSRHEQLGSRGYSMHSCVHSLTMSALDKHWDNSSAQLALTCVASEVPDMGQKDWWKTQRRLLRHAKRLKQFITEAKLHVEEMGWAVHTLGDLYANQGKLVEAEELYVRALRGYEITPGRQYTSTFQTISNLAVLYFDQGRLKEAEEMYLRALRGKEEV